MPGVGGKGEGGSNVKRSLVKNFKLSSQKETNLSMALVLF